MKKVDIKNNLSILKKVSPFFNYWKKTNELQNIYALENETESLLEIEIDLNMLIRGQIGKEVYEVMQATIYLDQNKKEHKLKHEIFDDNSIGVIINPVRFSSQNQNKIYSAIKIPARILKNGEIRPHDKLTPWIPRNLLEPAIEESSPTIGELLTFENLSKKINFIEIDKFNEYLQKSELLFKKVTGDDFKSFKVDEFEKLHKSSLRLRPIEVQNTGVTKLFERVNKGLNNPSILRSYSSIPKEKKYYKYTKSFLIKNSFQHVGHFTPNFPLSTSQRSTLYKYFCVKSFEPFPIDGPPGTGKTTVIQSIIANSFVQSALKQNASPELIAVCGATNQSVKNVIDTLNNLQEDNPLSSRWIPSLTSFGLFCAAKMREESSNNYHLQFINGNGFFKDLINNYSISELNNYYLKNYEKNFGKIKSVSSAVRNLHSRLVSTRKIQNKDINKKLDVRFIDVLFGGISKLEQKIYENKLDDLSGLDCSARYYAFLLATHYWEGRWLLELKKYVSYLESKTNNNQEPPEIWRWKSMLTPTFVSTISMAPKFFDNRFSNDQLIDLLIFDEAGQTLPEEGVIVSTLAKKVVVVGDTKQLKPYTLIPESLDEIECDRNRLLKATKKDFSSLSSLGFTSSKGSLMKLSKSVFLKRDVYGSGASLNEHRRSVKKIVQFCNELSYHGRLIPCRETPSRSPFKPFVLIESKGKDQFVGSSRKNEIESIKITEWLDRYKESLIKNYNTNNIADVVAILTPFTAQSKILKRRLKQSYPEMIIGTVNSLQGAERPVIIFSSTYDSGEQVKYMLDNDETLINVAVSRAKDSFIVFGSLECLRYGNNRPSNLLAKYCLEDLDKK